METTRPPGFPGNPPARMPRAPTPARSPPPRPLRCGEITFRPTHDVGPRNSMHFGAQSRGLRAPCERFAPWVTPGPRITRFRLAADLGRMGLDTHRVSNKVSKITSRHLVPLDRAFPAHALVHDSKLTVNDPNPEASHRPILYDSGRPSSVIWFRTLHATTDSATRPPRDRARSRSPRIDLYRKNAFSTRAWSW